MIKAAPKSRLARYLVVGGIAYVIEIATLYILHHKVGWSSLRSVAVSFWVGLIVAFLLQKIVTFENKDRRAHILARQVGAYGLLVLFNYLVTLLAVKYLSKWLSVYLIRSLIILLVACWNFPIYNLMFRASDNVTSKHET